MDSPDLMVSKPTDRGLSAKSAALGLCVWGAGCFHGVGNYLQGTVGQRLSLFI